MGTIILPKDTEFGDGNTARGTDVRSNDQYIRDFINNGNLGQANLTKSETYPWTGIHTHTVSDANNDNNTWVVSAVMVAGKYGCHVSSSAAQINSALFYGELTNSSSTVPIWEGANSGTGSTFKSTNSNTAGGVSFEGINSNAAATATPFQSTQAGTGAAYGATLRTLTSLNASLTAKTQTSTNNVNNSTTETAASDLSTTLPADFLKAGTTLRLDCWGTMDSPGAAPATILLKVKYGTTTLLSTGAFTPAVSLSGSLVRLEGIVTCISTGATGTVEAQGLTTWNSNTIPVCRGMGTGATGSSNTAVITIDTTASTSFTVTATFGSAVSGSSITWRAGTLEIVK